MARLYLGYDKTGKQYYSNIETGERLTPQQVAEATPKKEETGGFISEVGDMLSSAWDTVKPTKEWAQETAANWGVFHDTDPDKNKQLADAAGAFDIPLGIAYSASTEKQDELIRDALSPRVDFDRLDRENPKTAEYFADPANMAISHDDIAPLAAIESTWSDIQSGYELARTNRELNEMAAGMMHNNQTELDLQYEEKEKYRRLSAKAAQLQKKLPQKFFSAGNFAQLTTGFMGDLFEGARAAAVGATAGIAAGTVAPVVGNVIGAGVGASAGFAYGMAQAGYRQSAGEKYRQLLAQGYSKADARAGAVVTGTINGLLNMPFGASILRSYVMKPIGEGVLKNIGVNLAEQAAEGAAMGVGDVLANKTAAGNYTFNSSDVTTVLDTSLQMVAVGTLMSTPGYGWSALHAIGKKVDASATLKRDPQKAKEFVDTIVYDADGNPIKIEFDAERIADYIGTLDAEEAAEFMAKTGITEEQLNKARTAGETVSMTFGTFVTLTDVTKKVLYADVKVNGEKSAREVKDINDGNAPHEPDTSEYQTSEIDVDEETRALMTERETEITQSIDAELDADPTYKVADMLDTGEQKGTDSLKFDLQLFGQKGSKKVAEEYRSGKLSAEAEMELERIAKANGFSSADELAQSILNKRTKAEEKAVRVAKAVEEVRKEYGYDEAGKEARAATNDDTAQIVEKEAADIEADAEMFEQSAELDRVLDAEPPRGKDKIIFDLRARRDELKEEKRRLKKELNTIKSEVHAEDRKKYEEKTKEIKEQLALLRENLKAVLHDAQVAIGDRPEKKEARRGTLTAGEITAAAKELLANISIVDASDFRKLFADAKKARAKAEREYVRAETAARRAFTTPEKRTEEYTRNTKDGKEKRTPEHDRDEASNAYRAAAKHKERERVLLAAANIAKHNQLKVMQMRADVKKFQKGINTDRSKANKHRSTMSKNYDAYTQIGDLLARFSVAAKDYDGHADVPLRVWADEKSKTVAGVDIPEWILDDRRRYKFEDLTMEQAEDFVNTLKNIRHVARNEDKVLSSKKKESINDLRNSMLNELDGHKAEHEWAQEKEHGTVLDAQRSAMSFINDMLTMDSKLSAHFGEHSTIFKWFVLKKRELDNAERSMLKEYASKYELIMKVYGKNAETYMSKKIYVPDMDVTLSKHDMLVIGMHLGNASNRERLFSSRPDEVRNAKIWSEESVLKMLSDNLDKRDFETIQKTWDLLAELEPLIVEHERRLTGFPPRMVKAEPFSIRLKTGEVLNMRGGYYPLSKSLMEQMTRAGKTSETPLESMNNTRGTPTTAKGFTKERTSAQYGVSLEDVTAQHITDVIHDHIFRDYVSDSVRLMNQDFKDKLYGALGRDGLRMLDAYMQNVAGSEYRDASKQMSNKLLRNLRASSAGASIVLNFRVIVQNFANFRLYPGAVEGFSGADVVKGLWNYGINEGFWLNEFLRPGWTKSYMEGLSPYMQDLMRRPDRAFQVLEERGISFKQPDTIKGKLSDFSAYMMWASDASMSVPMWKQMYAKTLKETGDASEAMRRADLLIQRCNGSPNKADQSIFMRDNQTFYAMINPFMGFFNTEFNRWYREVMKVRNAPTVKNAVGIMGFAAGRLLTFNLLSEILMGNTPEEEETWGEWALRKGLTYPTTLVPMVRDICAPLIDGSFGEASTFGYRGSSVFQPISAMVNATSAIGRGINSAAHGEFEWSQAQTETVTRGAVYATGWPVWFNNLFWNAYDVVENGMEPRFGDLTKRRPKNER